MGKGSENEQFVNVADGRVLSYIVFGPGNSSPTAAGMKVVYLHGFFSGKFEAAIVAERAAAQGVTLIAIDRPGYGGSTNDPNRTPETFAKDVQVLLDSILKPDKGVIFWGVSGGSPYASACAALLPERAKALILAVPFACLTANEEDELAIGINAKTNAQLINVRKHPKRAKFMMQLLAFLQRTPLRICLLRAGGFPKVDLETVKAYPDRQRGLNKAARAGVRPGLKGQMRDLELMSTYGFDEALMKSIECPAHIWCGALDTVTPITHAQAYARSIPKAELHVVPDMGHFMGFKHGSEVLASGVKSASASLCSPSYSF